MVDAESPAHGIEGGAAEDNALSEEAASGAQEPSADGDEGAEPQKCSVSVEAESGVGQVAAATGENEDSDESDDDKDHWKVYCNRVDHTRRHEDRGQGRQGTHHQGKASGCKGGQGKAAVRAPAKALGNAPEKAVFTNNWTVVMHIYLGTTVGETRTSTAQ
ncbi:hypothetical protein HPB52_013245 [Rhipicephalus sanguineus]|uniref:Uncharacterized protein n=1 Tax=Rhipicephalus sanguineus TaxID=34632 RepID=A0A9D4Q2D9_RHISA|nr:hypothetical protein HPB52_013245 [Rhipicephalus sanguineus]